MRISALRRPAVFYGRIATLVPSDCEKQWDGGMRISAFRSLIVFYNPIATSRIAGRLLCTCSAFALHLRFPRLRNPAICRREQESRIAGHLLCISSAFAFRRPTIFYKRIATLVPSDCKKQWDGGMRISALRRPTVFYNRIATLVPSDCEKPWDGGMRITALRRPAFFTVGLRHWCHPIVKNSGTAECGFPHSAVLRF